MIVLVKQVPDTQNIKGDAMTPEGTVNRAKLPAIFNPEDLNALEEALKLKDKFGGKVTVITMGPPRAADILRESLFKGADDVVLLSDKIFAGADTLATSYALSLAVKKVGDFDIILCGRQAIDGDTAQVGPQTAEKLGVNQVTFVDRVIDLKDKKITVERSIEGGFEEVTSTLPVLLTVTEEANDPRPASAKRVCAYKRAMTPLETQTYDDDYVNGADKNTGFKIKLWGHEDIGAAPEQCGLSGSPTMVKEIESVVLEARDFKNIDKSKVGIESLIKELMTEHIIG
ncbi:MAG: electron transfer flavoprotein subunit beta [Spirochaetes bacterium GWF1_51_8]|nr:MAG: electron transfer flavoprotein subunit beta [Spirochaetes bacterium GWF1_51_8]